MAASPTPATFGEWVRTRRKQLDLTQAELGKRAGCSEAAIRKIEADERKPSHQLTLLIARALEVPDTEKEVFLQFARGLLSGPMRFELLSSKPNPNNLPALLTSTIDRVQDLSSLAALIRDPAKHLITIVGPPGIGKTRVGIQVGYQVLGRYPDGVWFVDLAEIVNFDFFHSTLARSIESIEFPPAPNLSQILGGLKDRSLLLILDNFEHLVDEAAMEVSRILKGCPRISILVTSRVPLHTYGEQEYLLPPLSFPPRAGGRAVEELLRYESVQLFIERIRDHQPKFVLTGEVAGPIVEICNILEGIPLALELAAATLRRMTLDEMASLLKGDEWIKHLGTPARDLPPRQRTLERVIDWSYTLLDAEHRDFFDRLGIFTSWFDAETASAVSEIIPSKAVELLTVLTDRSLLVREILMGKPHWRMLELIHEFANSRVPHRGHLELLRAHYFIGKMQTLRQNAPRSVQESYFEINFSNFHNSIRWAIREKQAELGFQLASELEDVWSSLGYFREGLGLMSQLFALPYEADPRTTASRLQMAADLAWQIHDFDTGLTYSKEAVDLGRVHGLKREFPWYLNRLGRIFIEQGKLMEAKESLDEALDLAYQDPTVLNPGSPLSQLGELALFEGNLEQASSLLERALTHLDHKDDIFLAIAKTDLAEIALAQGDRERAGNWLKQAFEPASRHIRRTIVFLLALVGFLNAGPASDADGRKEAAQFLGVIERLGEASGAAFNPYYAREVAVRRRFVQDSLSSSDWRSAFGTGLQWGSEEAMIQARRILKI